MRRLAVMIGFLTVVSCGGKPPRPADGKIEPAAFPTALELERELSGQIGGFALTAPAGLAVDGSDNVYITDANHRLVKLDREGRLVRETGGYGSSGLRFSSPADIFIDRGLSLFLLDTGNRRIVQMDMNLNYVTEIIPEDAPEEIVSTLSKFTGLLVSDLGEITVADYDNSRLIRLDNFYRFSRYVGDFGYGSGALLHPLDLAGDRNQNCYVADAGNGRVTAFDDYGNHLYDLGRGILKEPAAVAISPRGTVWVADRETDSLYVFYPDGRLGLVLANPDTGDRRWTDIQALAFSRNDRLFVADGGNNRVLIYRIIYEPDR